MIQSQNIVGKHTNTSYPFIKHEKQSKILASCVPRAFRMRITRHLVCVAIPSPGNILGKSSNQVESQTQKLDSVKIETIFINAWWPTQKILESEP